MKRLGVKVCILLMAFGISTACSRHAIEVEPEEVKKDFGPRLQDTDLNLKNVNSPLKPAQLSKDKIVSVSSSAWFDLANELLEGNSSASSMGGDLVDEFYKIQESHTTMSGTVNPPGNPFAEAAYWFARPVMTKAYEDTLLSAESKVVSLAKTISVPVSDLEKYPPPEIVLDRMIQSLTRFKEDLAAQNADDQVIAAITSDIDTQFTPDLENMRKSATFDPKAPLINNLRNLEVSLAKLPELSDFDRQHLLMQVRIAITLTEKCDLIKNSDDALSFLVDVWLAKEMRRNFPDQLKNVFSGLSEAAIFSLATLNQSQIIEGPKWSSVKNEMDTLILQDSSLVALYLKNNGFVLDPGTWASFQPHAADFDKLVGTPDIKYFSKLVANIPSDNLPEQRYALISNWLGVPYRIGIPDEIKAVFSTLNEQDLLLLQNNNYLFLLARLDKTMAKYRYGLIDALDKRGLDYVRQLFYATITSAIKERLDLALIPIAKDYSNQISNTIIEVLEKRRGDSEKVSKASYNDFGRYYLGKLIFGVQGLKKGNSQTEAQDNSVIKKETLPLIEKSHVNFVFKDNGWGPCESPSSSDPSVLGLSLGVLEDRLRRNPERAVTIEFQTISKVLAISGYHDAKNNLVESFMTSMTPGHGSELFSVADYDPEISVFAVPETISIKENFKMSEGSRAHPQVTVAGQMRLLYGFAKIMKFLKPWNPSEYDSGLGAIRIDEDRTLIPFSRNDYFLLSTGLGAYILKNIPFKMLGLVSPEHAFIDGTKIKNPSEVSAIAATLSDYTLDGMSHVVSAESTAEAILAMSEFYEEIKDLQKSTDPTIQSKIKGSEFHSSQENLQKIISGLVLFATNQLKSDDGGFSHSFNLDKMAPVPGERYLYDQLMMEKALLRAGGILQSGLMISRAEDNLFFLNSHFWNEELGFYGASENDLAGRVSLVDVARAIHNISVMSLPSDLTRGPNEHSLEQMQQLRELWLSRFFGEEIRKLPPILQVSEFSL